MRYSFLFFDVLYSMNKLFNSIEDFKIIKAVVVLLIFVFLAKVAGLLKEVVIARQFGISPEIDAYNFILTFVQWPVSLFGGVIGAALIPLVSKIRSQGRDGDIKLFRSEVLGVTITLSFMVMIIFYGVFCHLLKINIFGLEDVQVGFVRYFLPYLVWVIPLGFLTVLFSAWTMSSQRHINTFLEAMPALTISALVMFFGGAISIVVGLVVGFVIQTLLLAYFLYKHKEIEWPKFKVTSDNWSPLLSSLSFMLIGQFLMSVISLVDQYFAAGLGIGAISTLSYAEKILAIVLSLGVIVIGRAILPVFSDSHNQGRILNEMAIKWTAIVFLIGILVSIVFYAYSEAIVRVVFERGAFNKNDTADVSRLLRVGLWQIPFYIGGMVLSYFIISIRQYRVFVFINAFLLLSKILSTNVLLHFNFGILSLQISTIIVYATSFSLCLLFVLRFYK